jgi:cleavage stimulation factor subunit 3
MHDLDFMLALSTRMRLLYLSPERHVTSDSAPFSLAAQSLYTSTSTSNPAFACSHMTYLFLTAQAKKFLQERSPLYMTARSVLQDLRRHLDPLKPVDIPPRPLRNDQDRALVVNWRKYLKWEESNPLDIEDTPVLQSRIGYAYRKCLTQMRFYPELWYVLSKYSIHI